MDDEFAREVLRLAEGQTVEDFEGDLKSRAQTLEIPITALENNTNTKDSKQTSILTSSTQPRRSVSTGSQASHSTGISDISHTSKDNAHARASRLRGRCNSANSVSIKDYDQIVNNARIDYRRTFSFNLPSSPLSPSPSVFSLSSGWSRSRDSSPKRHIFRGLSRLRLKRTDSGDSTRGRDDCPHCPQSGSRHRRTLHTLPCGHVYCSMALRKMIKALLDNDDLPPTCCKHPIPGILVASVMSLEEQDALMNKLAAWEDNASGDSSTNETAVDLRSRDPSKSRALSKSSISRALNALTIQEQMQNLETALTLPHFMELRNSQEKQRDSVVAWTTRKTQSLKDTYAKQKIDLLPGFAEQKEILIEKHASMLAYVEDKHVLDEHEMRQAHDLESRNHAIALKHMEAYCRGESTSGEGHKRSITDQDMLELTKARRIRDQMDARHAGAISVLRGEQSRRISQRLLKQEDELVQLEQKQLKELEIVQQECDAVLQDWDEEVKNVQAKMQKWWNIEVEIWRKNLEKETNIQFAGNLPPISWPGTEEDSVQKFSRRNTVMASPVGELESARCSPPKSISPPRKAHRFSTAFSFRSSMIGRAQG